MISNNLNVSLSAAQNSVSDKQVKSNIQHLEKSFRGWAKNNIFKRPEYKSKMKPQMHLICTKFVEDKGGRNTNVKIPAQISKLILSISQGPGNSKVIQETFEQRLLKPVIEAKPKVQPKPAPKPAPVQKKIEIVKPKKKDPPKVVLQAPKKTAPPKPKVVKRPVTERTNQHNHGIKLERLQKSKEQAKIIRQKLENRAIKAHAAVEASAKKHNYRNTGIVKPSNEFMANVNVGKLVEVYVRAHNNVTLGNSLLKAIFRKGGKPDPAAMEKVDAYIATNLKNADSRFEANRISVKRKPGRRRSGARGLG
jgi:hypothetical protein